MLHSSLAPRKRSINSSIPDHQHQGRALQPGHKKLRDESRSDAWSDGESFPYGSPPSPPHQWQPKREQTASPAFSVSSRSSSVVSSCRSPSPTWPSTIRLPDEHPDLVPQDYVTSRRKPSYNAGFEVLFESPSQPEFGHLGVRMMDLLMLYNRGPQEKAANTFLRDALDDIFLEGNPSKITLKIRVCLHP